jgi:hypothetical protein
LGVVCVVKRKTTVAIACRANGHYQVQRLQQFGVHRVQPAQFGGNFAFNLAAVAAVVYKVRQPQGFGLFFHLSSPRHQDPSRIMRRFPRPAQQVKP